MTKRRVGIIKYKALICKKCRKEFHVERWKSRSFCSISCATLYRHENKKEEEKVVHVRKKREVKVSLWQRRKDAEAHIETLIIEDSVSEVL